MAASEWNDSGARTQVTRDTRITVTLPYFPLDSFLNSPFTADVCIFVYQHSRARFPAALSPLCHSSWSWMTACRSAGNAPTKLVFEETVHSRSMCVHVGFTDGVTICLCLPFDRWRCDEVSSRSCVETLDQKGQHLCLSKECAKIWMQMPDEDHAGARSSRHRRQRFHRLFDSSITASHPKYSIILRSVFSPSCCWFWWGNRSQVDKYDLGITDHANLKHIEYLTPLWIQS